MNSVFLERTNESTCIKVCGLTDEESVDVAIGSGVHAIGFVFAEHSPRQIHREQADRLLTQFPDDVLAVAVLQNYPNLSDFTDWKGWLQLSGNEDETIVQSSPCPVIRAFKWDRESLLRWDACPHIEAILIDGSTGGRGERFDVTALAAEMPTITKPVIIAGGLTAQNVEEVIRTANPAAVDVSSGVESSLGVKDPEKICEFVNAVNGIH